MYSQLGEYYLIWVSSVVYIEYFKSVSKGRCFVAERKTYALHVIELATVTADFILFNKNKHSLWIQVREFLLFLLISPSFLFLSTALRVHDVMVTIIVQNRKKGYHEMQNWMVFLEKKNVCQIFSKGALLKNKQICRECTKLLESSLVVRKKKLAERKWTFKKKKKAKMEGLIQWYQM